MEEQLEKIIELATMAKVMKVADEMCVERGLPPLRIHSYLNILNDIIAIAEGHHTKGAMQRLNQYRFLTIITMRDKELPERMRELLKYNLNEEIEKES